jgi:energy-coupling factor transporter ATP-binding protein EcfA2
MRVARVQLKGFRGIDHGVFDLRPHTVLVGPNGCGKSTIVDALALVLGRGRMVRALTEHDFTGSDPKGSDRIVITATLAGFRSNEPDDHHDWFRMGRAVPKWLRDGDVTATREQGAELCAQVAFAARFDRAELVVETVRYFHDDDDGHDPFDDDAPREQVPTKLLNDVGFYVLPARRSWEGVTSFNSELFRRTVSNVAGIPATEILAQRDELRDPSRPIESSAALAPLVTSLNDQLARLLPQETRFKLRVTAGDSESVLQALVSHYATGSVTLPAARHGMGLVSLQSLLLLLEVGRARRAKSLPFILALEEPELHLAPGLQGRLVAEAVQVADQTICTTHSPRVAAIYEATSTFVMWAGKATPLRAAPLAPNATNAERKLLLNRVRILEALMHPRVLVPEGRFDCEWFARLAEVGEAAQTSPPFSTVYGVVPTENSAVGFTVAALRALRPHVVAVVDGDGAGDGYVVELARLPAPPDFVLQWPVGWAIEDVVGWALAPGGQPVVDGLAEALGPDYPFNTLTEFVALLKSPNQKAAGLKENVAAHDVVAGALRDTAACRRRVADLLDCLVNVGLGRVHALVDSASDGAVRPRRVRVKLS